MDGIPRYTDPGNFNDLETFKKIEESNQKIKDRAMERNRQREIDDLNKNKKRTRLWWDVVNLKYLYKKK